MRLPTLNVSLCTTLFVGLGVAAYFTGRWQGELAMNVSREPRVQNAASLELAARAKARADAYAKYLDHKKFTDKYLNPHPAADAGIDLAKDPKGGLEKLAKLKPSAETQAIYNDAFEAWAKNPKFSADAAAAAWALPDGKNRTVALKGVADGWAEANPKACLDWAATLPAINSGIFNEALKGVVSLDNDNRDPALAAQYVDQIQDASIRNKAIQNIGQGWGETGNMDDAAAALTWLDQAATGQNYDKAVNDIFSSITRDNPANAVALIDKINDPDVRAQEISALADSWGNQDPAAALQWVQGLPDTDQATRDKITPFLISSIASQDPQAALQLVQNLPASDQATRDQATVAIAERLASENPTEFAAIVQNAPDPSIFLPQAGAIAQGLATSDPQAALTWVNKMPDGAAQTKALNNVLTTMASTDFSGAWSYAANLSATDTGATMMNNLLKTYATQNPTQAATLIGQFPDETSQLSATSTVAATWAVQDTTGFANWVNALPTGSQHDTAVAAAVKAVQALKIPAPERTTLLQSLNKAIQVPASP